MPKNEYILIGTDTDVVIEELKDADSGDYVNTATVTMALFGKTPLNPDAAAVVDVGGTKTKIKITGHTLTTDDYIKIARSEKLDGEYQIDAVETDYITIVKAYEAHTLTGNEEIYVAVHKDSTWPITLTHDAGKADGYYLGVLPNTLKNLVEYATVGSAVYYLFVTIAVGGDIKKTEKLICKAIYPPEN